MIWNCQSLLSETAACMDGSSKRLTRPGISSVQIQYELEEVVAAVDQYQKP